MLSFSALSNLLKYIFHKLIPGCSVFKNRLLMDIYRFVRVLKTVKFAFNEISVRSLSLTKIL